VFTHGDDDDASAYLISLCLSGSVVSHPSTGDTALSEWEFVNHSSTGDTALSEWECWKSSI
jgi:hypothetical protein